MTFDRETTVANGPVMVVGAGIGGLASAIAIAAAGYRVEVFEQAPEFSEVGAGIQLGPNAYRMLERLGLAPEAHRLAVFPEDLIMMDAISGEEVARIPVGDRFLERFRYPYALIHRADLHQVLLDKCNASPRIRLNTAHVVESFSELNGEVMLRMKDGAVHRGIALVGADGLWSRVRSTIVGDGEPRVSGHIAYRAVLPISEMPERLRRNAMILWAGPRNHLVQYPLRGGELFNLVAVFHSDRYVEGWNIEGDAAELNARFSGVCESVRSLLSKIESWRMWVLCDRDPVATWTRGRATLVGDAAHPMLQYLAQGAGQALEDAVVLGDQLAAAEGDIGRAFQSYERQRYLRAGRCQVWARLYGDIYHAAGVVRELRNEMLLGRTPEQSYNGMAWLYDPVK
jgi:2-polyprenyl-6-methoxyphenol hydroxylase-like FAD-dependent oxidoreductase